MGPASLAAAPNALWGVPADELPALAAAMASLRSEQDYRALSDRWAVRRTDPRFWATSDALMAAYRASNPAEAGLLDLNRLDNR